MADNAVDTIRHQSVFHPDKFGERRIDIVGVGATGSRIALSLAKLGVRNLHVWDDDIVESHNIANQAFFLEHIGSKKVTAVADLVKRATGLEVTQHDEKVTPMTNLGSVVFLLTDTMSSRKEIWDGAIKFQPAVDVMIETRMGVDQSLVFTISSKTPEEGKYWEDQWYPDEAATEESPCGGRISVGPTAELVSGYAVWSFIRWFEFYMNGGTKPHAYTLTTVRPVTADAYTF